MRTHGQAAVWVALNSVGSLLHADAHPSIVRPSGCGCVTFVYSKLEFRGEFIEVLFDGRDEVLAIPTDSVRKVSTRQ